MWQRRNKFHCSSQKRSRSIPSSYSGGSDSQLPSSSLSVLSSFFLFSAASLSSSSFSSCLSMSSSIFWKCWLKASTKPPQVGSLPSHSLSAALLQEKIKGIKLIVVGSTLPYYVCFLWLSSHHTQPYCDCFLWLSSHHTQPYCVCFLWLSSHHTQPYPAAYMTDDWFIGISHYYTPNPVSSAPSQGAMPPGVA